ncbi:MAG TPA: hypothetical protein VGF94_13990 [Kofleriaceae bacterium]|jgi:hypothetical protein
MSRFVLACFSVLALAACHHDSTPPTNPADIPLPPASGTPVGYLLDARDELKLRDEQLTKLRDIDSSLAARDAEIDTQLRQIQDAKKNEEQEEQPQRGQKPHRHNNAPGAAGAPTGDEAKLHEIRNKQDKDAVASAWTLLDPDQQKSAQHILEDHGVPVPGEKAQHQQLDPNDGTPVPGLEP